MERFSIDIPNKIHQTLGILIIVILKLRLRKMPRMHIRTKNPFVMLVDIYVSLLLS